MQARAREFWSRFVSRCEEIAVLLREDETVRLAFDIVESLLAQSGYSMCFDLTSDEAACDFIFSPEGDRSVAAEIDALLAVAPVVPGWRLFGRRQRRPAAEALVFVRHVLGVDLTELKYALMHDGATAVVMASGGVAEELSPRDVASAVSMLLWHAVGEAAVLSLDVRVDKGSGTESMALEQLVIRLDSLRN